jgi:uncharacterized protein (DUF433 family)
MSDQVLVSRSPDVLGGTPVFYGTRVPVQTLIDYLAQGETITAFLDDFPTVREDQVLRFLDQMSVAALAASNENSD